MIARSPYLKPSPMTPSLCPCLHQARHSPGDARVHSHPKCTSHTALHPAQKNIYVNTNTTNAMTPTICGEMPSWFSEPDPLSMNVPKSEWLSVRSDSIVSESDLSERTARRRTPVSSAPGSGIDSNNVRRRLISACAAASCARSSSSACEACEGTGCTGCAATAGVAPTATGGAMFSSKCSRVSNGSA